MSPNVYVYISVYVCCIVLSITSWAGADIEKLCEDMGTTCICSAPLSNSTWTAMKKISSGQAYLAEDPKDKKLCYNNRITSGGYSPDFDGVYFGTTTSKVSALKAATVDLPSSSTGIDHVALIHNLGGGTIADAGRLVNDYKSTRIQARTCMRYYFRYHKDTPLFYIKGNCNQKQHEFKAGPGSPNPRFVFPFHNGNWGESPGYSHDLNEDDRYFDPDRGITVTKKQFWKSRNHTNGFELGGTLGKPGTTHCFDHWCRVEICFEANDIPEDWNNWKSEMKIHVLSPEKETFHGKGLDYPNAHDGNSGVGANFGINLYGNGDYQNGLCGTMNSGGRMFSHLMYASWPTANNQWIGPAIEMEGQGGQPPVTPKLKTPGNPTVLNK
jgi:hypothetical protein